MRPNISIFLILLILKYTQALNISVYAIPKQYFAWGMTSLPESYTNLNFTNQNFVEITIPLRAGQRIILISSSECIPQWSVKLHEYHHSFYSGEIIVRRETNTIGPIFSMFQSYFYFDDTLNYSDELSGNYTCTCPDNPNETQSIYIFWENSKNLINRFKKIKIQLTNPRDQNCPLESQSCSRTVALPCGVNKLNVPVYLYVQPISMEDESNFTQLNLNSSLMESQTNGYELDIFELEFITTFRWVCSTIENIEVVEIIFEYVTENFEHEHVTLLSNPLAQFIRANEKAWCCHPECINCHFTSNPSIGIYNSANAVTSVLLDPLIKDVHQDKRNIFTRIVDIMYSKNSENKTCTSATINNIRVPGFILGCRSSYYYNNDTIKSTFTSTEKYYANDLTHNGTSIYVLHPLHLEKAIRLTIKKSEEIVSSRTELEIPIVVDVGTWDYGNRSLLGVINITKTVVDIRDLSRRFNGTEYVMEKSQLCAVCEVNPYSFARGIIWSMQNQNGTIVFVNQNFYNETYRRKLFEIDAIVSNMCLAVGAEMKNVLCHVPLSDKDEWINSSVLIPPILARLQPIIEPVNNEVKQDFHTFYEGEDVEIPCSISSMYPTTVNFFYKKNPYTPRRLVYREREPKESLCQSFKCPVNTRYTVTNAKKEMSGRYACIAESWVAVDRKAKEAGKEFEILVKERKLPEIRKNPATLVVHWQSNETNKTLDCSATGDPLPETETVKWFHNGILHPENVQTRTSNQSHVVTTLRIPIVTEAVEGNYTCLFSNRFGDTNSESFLVEVEQSKLVWYIVASFACVMMIIIGTTTFIFMRERRKSQEKLIQLENDFKKGKEQAAPDKRLEWTSLPYISEIYDIRKRDIKLEKKLGSGQFGVVFAGKLCKDGGVSKSVAVKMLQEDKATLEDLEVLCNELKMMMYINHKFGEHKNIVNCIGAITSEFQKKKLSLVMELCGNGSLDEYLEKHKDELLIRLDGAKTKFSPEVYKWSYEIASGMRFLAKHNIVHIDLAARNVLLTWNNVAKVGDFGLSRLLHLGKKYYKNRGTLMFPANSTAPEAGMQRGKFSPESDVWSYGSTLWDIFSLENSEGSVNIPLRKQLERGIHPRPKHVSEEVYLIMAQCWALNPKQRPSFRVLKNAFLQLYKKELLLSGVVNELDLDENSDSSSLDSITSQNQNQIAEGGENHYRRVEIRDGVVEFL